MPEILLASDSDDVIADVAAAIDGPDTTIGVVRRGGDVRQAVEASVPDLVIADLQVGSMGGMAISMDLRLESDMERLPHVPILLLLDRHPDTFLARRSRVDGFVIKPLDPLKLRRALTHMLEGGPGPYESIPEAEWPELDAAAMGVPFEPSAYEDRAGADAEGADVAETDEESAADDDSETVDAG